MIGSVLGNRYEIISEVGSGGMARVYTAKDRYLQRIVAIKVLKDEYREDTEFLKRFDKEAQASASLTHPNIVQIYDVGRDNHKYYIVMEYVDGITLKEYIEERGSLDWREAINISIQICSALSKAHSRHIIHRDIKPHNIIMTSEGVPKVTDFGIARSVSADTATMKIETVGSVHYSSPEQVRGGYTDEQSDIYSIGITIFEMITGKLPFDGETPVAVALKHIQDEPPVPSTLKPGIPKALDYIILKAIAKNKQDRYANVTELINDLENIRSKQGAGQGLVLPNIKRENDKYNTKKFAPLGDEDLKKRQPARDADSPEEKENSSSRKYMPFIYVLLITTIVGGIFYFVSAILKDILPKPEERPKEIILGTYIARDIDEVLKELEQDGITPVIHEEPSDSVEKNVIIKQKPDPDISFKVGGMTPLELWVSTGEETVTIPTVKHQDFNTMKFKLQDELGLDVVVKEEYSEEIPSNLCTRSEPDANTVVNKGSKVTLYRSLGPEKKQVVVPNLSNLTYDEAVNKLLSEKLKLGNTYPLGREGYQGKIIDQAPKAGETVTEDSAVDIFFEEEGSSGDETPGGNSKTIKINLPQGGGYNFGDTVRLRAFVVDHATGEELQILNEPNFPVSEFPRSLVVSVPATGGVTIKVYINDLLVNEESF